MEHVLVLVVRVGCNLERPAEPFNVRAPVDAPVRLPPPRAQAAILLVVVVSGGGNDDGAVDAWARASHGRVSLEHNGCESLERHAVHDGNLLVSV